MDIRFVSTVLTSVFLVSGCESGGNGGPFDCNTRPVPANCPVVTPPASVQSPGGKWLAFDDNSTPVLLYISEAGDVRSVFVVGDVTDGPAFGAGSVEITGTDTMNGVLQARGIVPPVGGSAEEDLGCTLSGNVRERTSLTAHIVCSDSSAIVYDETFSMTPQPGYDVGSSLSDIAGNYTLTINPATNMLNIAADGTLFGMYHNGANCIVNGVVSIIDADYSFLGVEWTMTSCIDPIGIYEGAVMTGFAMGFPGPGEPPGSYYFILTGQSDQGLFPISVFFERT